MTHISSQRGSAEDKGSSKGSEVFIAHAANETGISLGQQQKTLQYGPNLGLTSTLLNEPANHLGHTPPKNNNEMGCKWQVYSRGSWSQRRHHRQEGQLNTNQEKENDTHADSRSSASNSGTKDINNVLEVEANTEFLQAQEAINMWEMIQQLGVTLGNTEEDQQSRILEKIRRMEDRDRMEAEKLGANISDP